MVVSKKHLVSGKVPEMDFLCSSMENFAEILDLYYNNGNIAY
jgi:hypothetical protein